MSSDGLGRELARIAMMIIVIVMTFMWTADLMIQSTIDMPRGEFLEVRAGGLASNAAGSSGADIEQLLR